MERHKNKIHLVKAIHRPIRKPERITNPIAQVLRHQQVPLPASISHITDRVISHSLTRKTTPKPESVPDSEPQDSFWGGKLHEELRLEINDFDFDSFLHEDTPDFDAQSGGGLSDSPLPVANGFHSSVASIRTQLGDDLDYLRKKIPIRRGGATPPKGSNQLPGPTSRLRSP